MFDGFPSEEVSFARGAIPPGQTPKNLQGPPVAPAQTHKFRILSEASHGVFKGGRECVSIPRIFQFRQRSLALFSTLNPAHFESCTGTPMLMNGSMYRRYDQSDDVWGTRAVAEPKSS